MPLLDHRVVAYSWTLPLDFKLRHRQGKWLLRRVLDRYVPQGLIDRPKMGFAVPINSGCAGRCGTGPNRCLRRRVFTSFGLVRAEPVRRAWQEHLDGTRNWQYPLWTVLMLQAWRERWAAWSERPRKVLYVVTHLWVGGAEATLTRLVTAEQKIADESIVVALRPGGPHADRMRAGGVTVVELNFGALFGIPAGLYRLAKLIARTKPDIVQGWMYHGDLAALIGLILSGRRRMTWLAWAIRGSDIDFSRYSLQLRLVVKTCALLSRLPDLITANSAAGLKIHFGYGYRPRRAEIIPNEIDTRRFRPNSSLRAEVRRELGIPAAAIVLADVARVNPMKDHEGFLEAMAGLPDLHALLIGADTERSARPA